MVVEAVTALRAAAASVGVDVGVQSDAAMLAIAAVAVLVMGVCGVAVSSWLLSLMGGKRRPPFIPCMPLVGGFMKFVKGPLPLIDASYRQMGDVFTVPLFHKRITFLIGPHVSSHFFKASDEALSQKEVYQFNVPTFGPGVVFDVDHLVRREQFRFFADALRTSNLKTYVKMMVAEAEAYFESWPDEGEVDLLEELSGLIILTASRCLMGREVREHLFETVSTLFHDLDMGMQPISVLFPYLPIPAHVRRDKSRAELARIFSKIITNRRETGASEGDLLQTFIDAKYKTARHMTDEEITGMLIAALFAGQHTSSITSTWTGLMMLSQKSHCWPKVEEEQREAMRAEKGEGLNYDSLLHMDYLYVCIKEALRMHPPLIMLMRYVHNAFDVTSKSGETFTIPKGHIVATSPKYAMTLGSVFKEPEKYDPERFLAPREEDKAMPFSYIGFGGGRHGCMGETFAYMQIKVIWSMVIRSFDLDLEGAFPEPDFTAMVVGPKPPCKVRFRRRKL